MRPQAVYIHWPLLFLQKSPELVTRYTQALCSEIRLEKEQCDGKGHPEVLYIGGGGVNFVPEGVGLDISGRLRELYNFDSLKESTIEIANAPIDAEKLALWQSLGIKRIVIGVHNATPLMISVVDLPKDIDSALDCTITITAGNVEQWRKFFEIIIMLPIKQLSISFIKGGPRRVIIDFYEWLREFLVSRGMQHYELYSFAYPGYESHYMNYFWQRKSLKGFGVGAESCDGITRKRNEASVIRYIEKSEQGRSVTSVSQLLTSQEMKLEQLLMELRTRNGVSRSVIYQGLDAEQRVTVDEQVALLEYHGLIMQQEGMIILAPDGWGHEDEIILRLAI